MILTLPRFNTSGSNHTVTLKRKAEREKGRRRDRGDERDGDEDKDEYGSHSSSHSHRRRVKKARSCLSGAAAVMPPPPPPIATFVNVSGGIKAMEVETGEDASTIQASQTEPVAMAQGHTNTSYPLINTAALRPLSSTYSPSQSTAAASPPSDPLQYLLDPSAAYPPPPSSLSAFRRSLLLGAANSFQHQPLHAEYLSRRDPTQPLQCRVCSSTSVESSRYICRQQRDYVICSDCFLSGRYLHTLSSSDFERYLSDDASHAADAERMGATEWSREEIIRLMQALSQYDDDWESVSEHVKTRTKDECCLKFAQMPIEEPFLEQMFNTLHTHSTHQPRTSPVSTTGGSADGSGSGSGSVSRGHAALRGPTLSATHGPDASGLSLSSLPFGDCPNPILAQVSFISAHISPSVAAAAAQAAITYATIKEMAGQPVRTPFGIGRIVVPSHHTSASAAATSTSTSSSTLSSLPSSNSAPFSSSSSSFTRSDGIVTVDLPWGRLYAHANQLSIATEAEALEAGLKPIDVSHKQNRSQREANLHHHHHHQQQHSRQPHPPSGWLSDIDVVGMSGHALQSAARKAWELSGEEERKQMRFTAQMAMQIIKRIELKLSHLSDLDNWCQHQHSHYESHSNQYAKQRIAFDAATQKANAHA